MFSEPISPLTCEPPAVSAVIVTRGDVDLSRILDSLPSEWEILVWDNCVGGPRKKINPYGDGWIDQWNGVGGADGPVIGDLSVYGRYAAIEYTSCDLVYVQDDDCIVSDPQAIVDEWLAIMDDSGPGKSGLGGAWLGAARHGMGRNFLVANQPQEFRHSFYEEHCLVGFGACFHRDAPAEAFGKWNAYHGIHIDGTPAFNRACDVVFTVLMPCVLVDIPVENLPWATGPDRMYRNPSHFGERKRMLDIALKVRNS